MAKPTIEAVMDTVREFDRTGRESFMRKYEFADRNITYEVEIDGKVYPSKAIYGAAFARMPGERARTSQTCDGTEAREHLDRLGLPILSKGGKERQVVSTAQRIRTFVIDRLITPARERGDTTIEIVSGDVHREMDLSNQMPIVCTVLEGGRFAEQAGVELVDRHSPIGSDKPSSTIRYQFSLLGHDGVILNREVLEQLKTTFLHKHRDFASFDNCPSFAAAEDDYKRALIGRAAEIVRENSGADAATLGAALIELVAGRSGLQSNLIDWRAMKVVDEARANRPGLVEKAVAKLALASDGEMGVSFFADTVWPAFSADRPSKPYAESRMVPTMLRALVKPDVLPIRSTPTDNAAKMLMGDWAFAANPLTSDEIKRVDKMACEVMRIMDEEWVWGPRDMWDVQGFFWETCQKRLGEPGKLDPIPVWLVNLQSGGEDPLPRFLERGEWSLQTDAGSDNDRRVREMQVGDRIFVKEYISRAINLPFDANGGIVTGHRIRAEGTITETSEDGQRVGVEWQPQEEPRTWYFYTNNDAVWRLHDPGKKQSADRLRRFLLDGEEQDYGWFLNEPFWHDRLFGKKAGEEEQVMSKPTNLILYGPPGTGKTYRTAEEAVRLCDSFVDYPADAEGRAALMARYGELVDAERIGFVTFHQNFSYEDFVEGLRPVPIENESGESVGFHLEAQAGVFQRMAEKASIPIAREGGDSIASALFTRPVWKMSLGKARSPEFEWVFEKAIEDGVAYLGFRDIDWSDETYAQREEIWHEIRSRFPDEEISINRGLVQSPDYFRNIMQVGDVVVATLGLERFRAIGIVTGEYEYAPNATGRYCHRRAVNWLWSDPEGLRYDIVSSERFTQKTIYQIKDQNLDRAALAKLALGGGQEGSQGQLMPHVLIIDEINRANISKVFGELITLLEPDKRLGQTNALTVRLPYSKREFGVPSNLHVIGTMNTADRSIALLDTALRRRFRFEELAPDPSLLPFSVGLIPLRQVLTVMNQRIEYLIDRDHRIGHALFMDMHQMSEETVDAAMRDKVIPLLAEYFFEDWSRIASVVGDGFLEKTVLQPPPGIEGDTRDSWSVRNVFLTDAYERLIKGSIPREGDAVPLADEVEEV